jgi:5-methylcytosine-specific restriction enzyme subunit McrC
LISVLPKEEAFFTTKTGIPIRNLWHMLLYVWKSTHLFGRWRSDVENGPNLDALLASILSFQIQQRLRIGLGRDYRKVAGEIYGIRGSVDFNKSLRRMSFKHGRAFCRYQVFQTNVPLNQIIKSTLTRLVQVGQFGSDPAFSELLRTKIRRLIQEMEGIDIIELKPSIIRREQLQHHDADYGLMLSICYLLYLRQMPCETPDDQFLPQLDRDDFILYDVFEKFVAEFYKLKLTKWDVGLQQIMQWPAAITSKYLPVMKPDLTLRHRGTNCLIILDTKFTKSSLVKGQWENITFNRDHLFQIYAYIKSQEQISRFHQTATGILLYPSVNWSLQEKVEIQGHEFRWETIDLAKRWENIEEDLISIPERVFKDKLAKLI